ncbi:MAG: serine/threonine-protein phosphatase [Chlamydiae bacterium]|nr:serine/threonine-protein phosphatase [Chlamydiota bacterium]
MVAINLGFMMDSGFSLHAFGHSDRGLFRQNNEDYYGIFEDLFIVADGLGGHNAGEIASKMAVESIAEKILSLNSLNETPTSDVEGAIRSIVKETSKRVYETSLKTPEQKGMGTTIASLWIQKSHFTAFHVGDSRIYRCRNDQLTLMTLDHANEVSIDEDQLGEIRRRYLTQAVGTTPDCEARVLRDQVQPNDRFIVCSDGLTDYVTTKEMELLLLKNKDARQATHALIEAALSRGGRDNITAIVLNVARPTELSDDPADGKNRP